MEKKIEKKAEEESKNSCLFGDSKILLADGRWKEVRHLRSGDVIVDRYLAPQKVITVNFTYLGDPQKVITVNFTYLGDRPLYSFNGEKKPLFTPEHQFFTSSQPESRTSVVSLKLLYDENPQIRGEKVEAMDYASTTVLTLDGKTDEIQEVQVSVEEHTEYEEETKVYFLLVTGEKVMRVYVKLDDDKKFPVSASSHSKTVNYHAMKIKTLWEFMAKMDIYPEGLFSF